MAVMLAAGVAVVDFVFRLDALPRSAEKHRARDARIVGGGCAANAAVAAARLGGTALLAARVGDDAIGAMIVADLEAEGVDCGRVKRFAGRRSSFSSVYVDRAGERQIVNFRDDALSFEADWLALLLPRHFDAALGDTRWPKGAAAVLAAARRLGRPGVLDAEAPSEASEALRAASHIAFSAEGLRDLSGHDRIEDGLRRAAAETGAWVCVTQGARGVVLIGDSGVTRIPGFAVEVADTLGAGDVWHGAFALGLGEGMAEPAAVRFANAAAAIKCTRFGGRAGTPTRAEVEAFLRERPEAG